MPLVFENIPDNLMASKGRQVLTDGGDQCVRAGRICLGREMSNREVKGFHGARC